MTWQEVFAGRIHIKDRRSKRVKAILLHLPLLPIASWKALREAGLERIYISNRPVPEMDNMQHLRGQRPSHWPKGQTWDDVPGTYNPERRYLLIGGGPHGSCSLALHEAGHAIANLLGYLDSPELIEHHRRLYDKLTDYEQQAHSRQGRDEFFAESVARLRILGSGKARKHYDKEYVLWLKEVLWGGARVNTAP